MNRPDAAYWVDHFMMSGHVEGGYFREVYRSPLRISKEQLPVDFKDDRNFSTSIYFLLEKGQFSAFHRIASDELWHFYFGDTLYLYEIEAQTGFLNLTKLGTDPSKGEVFQYAVKAGNWFASRVGPESAYALVGCTVSPGFDFEDFELANREALSKQFPQHAPIIESLTR